MARKPFRKPALKLASSRPAPRFDAKWQRRNRRRAAWRRWRARLVVALIVGLALATYLRPWDGATWTALAPPAVTVCAIERSAACVIDGDTLRLGERRVRLTGFDAPEIEGACPAERVKAVEAREEMLRWLNAGPFELDGGSDPSLDKYGRELRAARRGGDLLADHMIARGLAHGGGWADWGEIDWCTGT